MTTRNDSRHYLNVHRLISCGLRNICGSPNPFQPRFGFGIWKLDLEILFGNRIWIWIWKLDLEFGLKFGFGIWNLKIGFRNFNWKLDLDLEIGFGIWFKIWIWDLV